MRVNAAQSTSRATGCAEQVERLVAERRRGDGLLDRPVGKVHCRADQDRARREAEHVDEDATRERTRCARAPDGVDLAVHLGDQQNGGDDDEDDADAFELGRLGDELVRGSGGRRGRCWAGKNGPETPSSASCKRSNSGNRETYAKATVNSGTRPSSVVNARLAAVRLMSTPMSRCQQAAKKRNEGERRGPASVPAAMRDYRIGSGTRPEPRRRPSLGRPRLRAQSKRRYA